MGSPQRSPSAGIDMGAHRPGGQGHLAQRRADVTDWRNASQRS